MRVTPSALVCFSHLPWDHVFQRPHHLMSRAARDRRVVYVEEPAGADEPSLGVRQVPGGITVATPLVPAELDDAARNRLQAALVGRYLAGEGIHDPIAWYYTPNSLPWASTITASVVVYDCMDELSAFDGASPRLPLLERELLREADVVFCGGQSLFESKRDRHPDVHAFPSAVDVRHFAAARRPDIVEPDDQVAIPRPRLGWFGVLDERFDAPLVAEVAARRPDWAIVLLGPVSKIDPATLPSAPNVHGLGRKPYEALPDYLAGWDVAIMPFARNAATKFISPTKTPEYLAGGRPVVSTSIRDVVHPYAERDLVRIADRPADFIAACEAAMAEDADDRVLRADRFLAGMSWDRTWASMSALVDRAARRRVVAGRAAATPVAASAAARPAGTSPSSVGVATGRGRLTR